MTVGGEQVALGFVFRQPQKIQHARKSVGNVMGVLWEGLMIGEFLVTGQDSGHLDPCVKVQLYVWV